MEQPKIDALTKVLRECNKTDEQIIDVLESIITVQMLMGGCLEDKINFEINKAQRESYLRRV